MNKLLKNHGDKEEENRFSFFVGKDRFFMISEKKIFIVSLPQILLPIKIDLLYFNLMMFVDWV